MKSTDPSAPSSSGAASLPASKLPQKIPAIRILLADDHTVVRDGLSVILDQEPGLHVVAQAATGRQAVELWHEHRPDITLMDLQMPQLNGVSAISEIRATNPEARIIVLTTFDGDEDIYRALRAGAKSYLLKDVRRDELFHCIREVHAGKYFLPPEVAAKLASRQPVVPLTSRELEVLRLLSEGKSNKAVAALLSIAEVTVKSHVRALFAKLNVLSRTEAIAVANRTGLLHR
ncbi:MAG TPA: response regulator transcription factor [Opitutaceae bacterium]|nr:response regulator transcription factor [Opitutaceae bacterium]